MRKWIALAAGVVILAAANYVIHEKERLLTEGRVVMLELAPVDPRSLMQGDYMALRFTVADVAFGRGKAKEGLGDGTIVLKLDARAVGSFARFDDGTSLNLDEVRMRYRIRNQQSKFGTNAFFFQEGTARLYQNARYGEFRVNPQGDTILTGLRGPDLAPLGGSKQPKGGS
jgi:uncharacterized membrane-anchored protein